MKTRLKQWQRLGLGLMLTWALLFLALFSYFMESRVDETVAHSHSETRRLTALQGNTHSIVVAVRSATPVPIPFSDQKLQQPASEPSQEDYIYSDVQNLAAWSAFGTQDVGSMSATVTRSRERQQIAQQEEDEDEGLEEVNDEVESIRTLKNEASNRVDSNPEDFYAYKSKSVVQHLWQGSANLDMLSPRLQKAVKVYLNSNKHGVLYKGKRHPELSSERVLCNMKKSKVKILDGSELPFSKLGWQKLVPTLPLEHLYGTGFGSCAVVTSAGAMLHSGLGKEIDSHDAVLRFNSAPTKGFERDVGNKTTIRIINSQILANPNYHFNVSSLYKNVTLVAWDPAPYTVNLHKWYENPDYNLFTPYTEYRRQFPDQPFYILHPKFIWQLWDMIQSNTVDDIQPNPPSSGFIGILLMMSLCERVDVYEYIPSHRQTDLCHYHERYYDAACTLGAYHPLLYEKVLVQRINTGTESDLQKGKVSLPGFSTLHCDPEL